jgi:hypothetical protein
MRPRGSTVVVSVDPSLEYRDLERSRLRTRSLVGQRTLTPAECQELLARFGIVLDTVVWRTVRVGYNAAQAWQAEYERLAMAPRDQAALGACPRITFGIETARGCAPIPRKAIGDGSALLTALLPVTGPRCRVGRVITDYQTLISLIVRTAEDVERPWPLFARIGRG